MRVLRVLPSADPTGGGPIEGILQMYPALSGLGIGTEIVCCDRPDAPWVIASEMPIYALGPAFLTYAYTPLLSPWLRDNVGRYDAVIVHGLWQYHSFATWRALRRRDIPYFVFTHGMLDPWFKRRYPLKHLKKWAYWSWADYRVLRDAKAVIFTCEEERLLARQSFCLYRAREAVTNYGTSSPPFSDPALFFDSYPELQGKRIVLYLGRIHEKKGCDLLLHAFSQLAQTDEQMHLVMAGPDQNGWQSSLQKLAQRLRIDQRITWTGMLQGGMKWSAFRASEVFCLPSHQENFGIVVAEALGCGKPVLVSNKVNIWREIAAQDAGFVDDDTVDGTVRNLRKWLALGPDEYREMTVRAEQCFASHFHIERAAERLAEILGAGQ